METSKQFDPFLAFQSILVTLVTDLKRLQEFSRKLKLENLIPLINDVLERVENHSFKIAVVGEFKRGKSTFINALLGQNILPVDLRPCTATLTRITYGLKPLVKVVFRDGHEEEVTIEKLSNYVSKLTRETQEIAANVQAAVVYYPVHYCENNIDIIDTPGLCDRADINQVTLSVLPQVDVAIMVILATSPFSEGELEFLGKLLISDLGRIIFVVNAIDRCDTPEEAETVVNYIRERIQENFMGRAKEIYGEDSPDYEIYKKKIGTLKVFGLSAYQALMAKETGDVALLAKSRFPEFEAALEQFLTVERGATVLQVLVNRAIASATEILKAISLQENGLAMDRKQFEEAYNKSVAEISDLRGKKAQEQNIFHSENILLELQQMKEDTKQIQDFAQRLSQQLIHMTSAEEPVATPEKNQPSLINNNYKKVLMDLLYDVSQLREFCQDLNLESISLIDNVVERIENKSFKVGIFGGFLRGKTTLLNAILGKMILPMHSFHYFFYVTYGSSLNVKVKFESGKENEISYENYLNNSSNFKIDTIQEFIVYYPIHYCQNNVDIIDTPSFNGLNDVEHMNQVTLSILPKVDAIIMIVLANSPFDDFERKFLEDKLLVSDLGRIIFVVNAIDRCNTPEEAETAVNYIRERIQENFMDKAKEKYGENSPEYEIYKKKIGTPKVFGLSAWQALKAKETGDTTLLAESHFPEFEAALAKLITQERGMISLQVLVNRAIASANEILQTISLRENALTMDKNKLKAVCETELGEKKVLLDRTKVNYNSQDFFTEIENIQNSILELKVKQTHEETLIEIEQGKLNEIRDKTEIILAKAQSLFE